MQKFRKILIILIIVAGSFALGFYVARIKFIPSFVGLPEIRNQEIGKPKEIDFSIFWDAWRIVEEKFVDRDKLNRETMTYGAVRGMLKSLNDPHTVFLDPPQAKRFQDDISGSFEGVGMEVGIRKGVLTVIAPLKGTPAEKAGLVAGDKIFKIDGKATTEMAVEEAVKLIRGPKGSKVKLTISRSEDGTAVEKEFEITRDAIKIPSLSWERKDSDIAYIELFNFTGTAVSDFKKLVPEILNSNINKLILDVRNNPGGFLEAAVDIASFFVDEGKTVAIERFGDGKERNYKSSGRGELKNLKTVILVNDGSASASEILAGALRDHNAVKIIGIKTFGKGSVQIIEGLRGGSSLKITVAKWLTPSGRSISDEGIVPDIEIKTKKDKEAIGKPKLEEDPVYLKALEVLSQ